MASSYENCSKESSKGSSIDWTTAFQSEEVRAGLQSAVAEALSSAMAARRTTNAQVLSLEQSGDSTPAAITTVGSSQDSEGLLTAPSFVAIFDTMPTIV